MGKKPARVAEPKRGSNPKPIEVPAFIIKQGNTTLLSFVMSATKLWSIASINRRNRDKDEGYQRVLPKSRVNAISKYISSGWTIPNSIIIALNGAKYDPSKKVLTIPAGDDVAWVIDGQHRLAGAHEASSSENGPDYEFPVVAFLDIDQDQQVEQFITINREAKGVPASLVLDLLDRIPRKKPSDIANERAADIAKELDKLDNSPFFQRIVIDRPHGRQVSLVNFVRKISPLVHIERGRLRDFSLEQQKQIINNYFSAIRNVFNSEWSKSDSIFFKTIGFGAMMNIFEDVFNTCIQTKGGSFQLSVVEEILKLVEDFEFAQWSAHGSGTKAEAEAAKDFKIDFQRALDRMLEKSGEQKIKL